MRKGYFSCTIRAACSLLTTTVLLFGCGGGGGANDDSVTEDTTPDAFTFTDQVDVALSTPTVSNTIVLSGINTATTITVTGGEYSIDGGAFTTVAASVSNGQNVTVRQTSSVNFSTTTNAILTIGGVSDTYSVTTLATDTTPNAFSFTVQADVNISTLIMSNSITVAGINTAAPISIMGGEYSINGGAFTSIAGTVDDGQNVVVRQTSSAAFSTSTNSTLTIGGVSGTFTLTTLAADTTPDAFAFTDQTNLALNTTITSNSITITGIEAAAAITITDGEYSINGAPFTSAASTVVNGQTVSVRQTSAATFLTTTDTVLSIGGVSDTFSVTTRAADTVPDAFAFIDQTNIALSTPTTSNSITVTGIDAAAAISITGGEYSIDGAPFTSAPGTVTNTQTVSVRQNSAATFLTTTDTVLSIGGVSDTFSVTTRAADTVPDAFAFTDQTNVTLNTTITSNSITITGIEAAAAITITDGEYSINGAPFTSAVGTVNRFQTVTVRHTSSSFNSTFVSTLINIGGVSETFTTTTGPIGTGFNQKRGFDSTVLSISPANDGSGDVYVGGYFGTFNGIGSNRIIRLNSDGSVDAGFDVGNGIDGSQVQIIIPATDGSGDVYVGGFFIGYNGTTSYRIIRLNSDGSVDTGFDVVGFNSSVVYSISPTTDGSGDVYVGGSFTRYNETANIGTTSNRIIRLNSDGSVDTGFDVGSGFDSDVRSISLANDGSGDVYVGGFFTTYNGTGSNRIIRLNSDGTVDAGFNVGNGFDAAVYRISPAIDGSGDVYMGGNFTTYNGIGSNRIIRLNSDGTADTGFNVGTGFFNDVRSINPATDGSGDVYVGGLFTAYNGTPSSLIIRLNSDGTVDAGFDTGNGFNHGVFNVSPATDGSGDVYVGGAFNAYLATGNAIAVNQIIRLNSDGTVDAGFDVSIGFNSTVIGMSSAIDGSDDVYMGGNFDRYNGIVSSGIIRLNSDGTVDAGFNVGSGFNNSVFNVSPATDGSGDVYVGGGFTAYNGTVSNRIIRLNSDGTIDVGFNVGSGFDFAVRGIIPATDGSGDVYVVGDFESYNGTGSNGIIRLNSDGTVDSGFNVGSGFSEVINFVVLSDISPATDGSGDVYIVGAFTAYNGTGSNRIIRLNSNGTVDSGFNVGSGFNSLAVSVSPATDASGDVYVGGIFSSYNGTASDSIVRLNSDGTIDPGFNVGTGFNNAVLSVSPATDGSESVYVCGFFTAYNGTDSTRIIRLNSNGTVDASFDVGSGFDRDARIISPSNDGSGDIFVGGDFMNYQTTTTGRIARLNPDGSVN